MGYLFMCFSSRLHNLSKQNSAKTDLSWWKNRKLMSQHLLTYTFLFLDQQHYLLHYQNHWYLEDHQHFLSLIVSRFFEFSLSVHAGPSWKKWLDLFRVTYSKTLSFYCKTFLTCSGLVFLLSVSLSMKMLYRTFFCF